jgi:hypothetical protein
MYLSPYPEHTKQTRCNNNLNQRNDFLRPMISNIPHPLNCNHENYIMDNDAKAMYQLDIERSSISTRNNVIDVKRTPVQQSIQNNYYTTNYETLNHNNNQEVNNYLTRNPVNTRRDNMEKIRLEDRQDFLKMQGGNLNNFADLRFENTRKNKVEINSSNYLPMPRTMAIPKENI